MINYEKKYNNALAIMEEYKNSGNAGVIAENVILKAFPELSKPTEEQIKNKLSNLIKMNSDIIGEELKMNMLEWIKKASVNNNIDVQNYEPKFKIHDIIRSKNQNDTDIIIITSITEKGYNYNYVVNIGGGFFTFLMEDNYELID